MIIALFSLFFYLSENIYSYIFIFIFGSRTRAWIASVRQLNSIKKNLNEYQTTRPHDPPLLSIDILPASAPPCL